MKTHSWYGLFLIKVFPLLMQSENVLLVLKDQNQSESCLKILSVSKAALKAAVYTKQRGHFLTGFSRVSVNLSPSHFFAFLLWSKPKLSKAKVTQVARRAENTHIHFNIKITFNQNDDINILLRCKLFITSFYTF